ncbi:MAG: hypothetical protein PHH37_06800 [Paludibacter sp.]|nr:hypothetical protein [Paludibacter sp.]
MNKLGKFICVLAVCILAMIGIQLLLPKNAIVLKQFMGTLFYFVPAIAVWISEKKNVGKIFREYKVNLKSIYVKRALIYILGTAFIYPLIYICCIFLAGNVLGIQSFGQVMVPNEGSNLFGIILPENIVLRFSITYLSSVCFMLVAGLTYNMIFALGGELGWRGFLEKNLNIGYYKRNIVTGLIWGTWFLPVILFNYTGMKSCCYHILIQYIIFIVSSFLLNNVYQNSGSLFIPAAVQGLLISANVVNLTIGGDALVSQFTGLSGIISLVILTWLFKLIPQAKADIHIAS